MVDYLQLSEQIILQRMSKIDQDSEINKIIVDINANKKDTVITQKIIRNGSKYLVSSNQSKIWKFGVQRDKIKPIIDYAIARVCKEDIKNNIHVYSLYCIVCTHIGSLELNRSNRKTTSKTR